MQYQVNTAHLALKGYPPSKAVQLSLVQLAPPPHTDCGDNLEEHMRQGDTLTCGHGPAWLTI